MKPILLNIICLFIFCFQSIHCCAQNISEEGDSLTTIIYNERFSGNDSCADEYCWMRIYDSVVAQLTLTYFEQNSGAGFLYPYEFVSVAITPTYRHLLEAEFDIRPYGIRSGCMYERWHRVYDSLTLAAI